MKNTEKQFTRDEAVERGEYEGGAAEQRWVLDGIVFVEICNANGYRVGFHCLGKASKVLE